MEFIFNQIWKERKMNLLAEGSLQGPAVGEFGGRQSAVKLQEFSAAPIAPTQGRVQRRNQLPSGCPHGAIDLGSVIDQYLERESKPTNQW